jgi:hypothetical protein
MGMSCHGTFRFLDWLDERSLSRDEIVHALTTLGLVAETDRQSNQRSHTYHADEEWKKFCDRIKTEQQHLASQKNETDQTRLQAFTPWNPIKKHTTLFVDIRRLEKHGSKRMSLLTRQFWISCVVIVVISIVLHAIFSQDIW